MEMEETEKKNAEMRVALAGDHGGFELKQAIRAYLEKAGYQTEDFGTFVPGSCDYPDFAASACEAVTSGRCDRAILCCGTGVGMSIAANKIRGIRAAVVTEPFSAEYCRRHNDANVLCLGQRVLALDTALHLVDLFLTTAFEGGRHERRLEKIRRLEQH